MTQTKQAQRYREEEGRTGRQPTACTRDEVACESQSPVVNQLTAILNELVFMDQPVSTLYDRLAPVTMFAPQCAEKEDVSKRGAMCDLEAALYDRLLHIRENRRKLQTLLDAIQI